MTFKTYVKDCEGVYVGSILKIQIYGILFLSNSDSCGS